MPTKFNLDIIRGSRYIKGFVYADAKKNPIDITGLDARMQIREKDTSPTAEIELSTANGRITTVHGDGHINIVLTAPETEAISIDTGVYDLELFDAGNPDIVDTILMGAVTVTDGITR